MWIRILTALLTAAASELGRQAMRNADIVSKKRKRLQTMSGKRRTYYKG